MRKLSWLVTGLLCVYVATPSGAAAQQKDKEEGEDFFKDVVGVIFSPNWNVYLQGGLTTNGRFLLQHPTGGGGGQQALRTNTGYNVGIGGGVDYFRRQGFRIYYLYSNNTLTFRTNNGDGSDVLDIDPDARLKSSTAAIELIRYLLPARAAVTPYGTLGFLGTWWGLDSSPLVQPVGGSSQFRMGASLAFGLQMRAQEGFGARLEVSSSAIGNPFTGRRSFRVVGGDLIDAPTSVEKWDYRLAGVYYFQKQPKKDAKGER